MKTKKNLFICLLTVFMSVFAFFGIMTMSTSYVSADSGIFEMKDAAGIRLGDHSGIRFFVEMDETHKEYAQNNEYGFLVFPQEYLTTKLNNNYENFDEDFHNNPDVLKVIIEGTKNIYTFSETDDGAGNIVKTYAANAALLDVKENNFKIKFTCVAYVVDNNGEYIYAINEDLGKSMQEVASMAYFDTENVDNEVLMATYGEESTTFNYNLGSTDNPILITDAAQLSMISEEVEAGTTDYAGMNFQLANNIALDNGFTPIASTFAGNILGDGKQVSGELVVELVDGKTATELNYVENVIIPTHFLELNSDTFVGYDAKTNPDGEKGAIYNASNNFYTDKGTLVSEETWKEDGITGDYSGNAIKITANYYMNWTLTNPYNQAQINKLADNYDFVRFYLAGASTDETDTSWYYNLGGGMLGAYYGNDSDNASIAYSRAKQWIEFKFSIEKFVELLNSASFEFFNVHWNKAGGKEGGNATATVVLYMSNIEFVTEPTPTHWFKVSEQSWATDRILYNDSSVKYQPGGDFVTYMNETEVSELGFAGGYTGAAVRYTSQNNSGWSLKNIFSERQLSKIKDTYDHLYIWFAAAPISDETTEWSDPMTEDLIALTSTGQTSIPVNNTNQKIWRKFIVPIDSFITYLGENSAVGFFNRGWGNGKWGEAYYYFGDIGFGNASTIEIFGKTASLTDLTSGQDVDITYLSSSELASAGVTAGGYTGNAVKFSLGSSSVYRKFYLTVPTFTDAEKEEILSTYTNVSMYIYTNKGQANAGLYVNTTSDNYWNHTHNTWKKYTITVQQYFDYVEANASDGKVLLFYNYISTQANAPTVEVYFGNISFE